MPSPRGVRPFRHNLLEAARAPGGCVALHGPHTAAVAAAAAALAAARPAAAARVTDADDLAREVGALLRDETLLRARRAAAAETARWLEHGLLRRVVQLLAPPLQLPRALLREAEGWDDGHGPARLKPLVVPLVK